MAGENKYPLVSFRVNSEQNKRLNALYRHVKKRYPYMKKPEFLKGTMGFLANIRITGGERLYLAGLIDVIPEIDDVSLETIGDLRGFETALYRTKGDKVRVKKESTG